ncbi:CHAT domain-containing protein [Thalassobaculum litoreum]|uniref:CHAT domain-containing protein n=1 Tax=Thalassobaculum litoreum DSM 18839 TaxID=1123362 RepID=A0A8G2EW94_9PROT|nr:CHAT domain-containing protein [Thalassobaculum litoreum]SDG17508.1 CHAT domain-containing protein [Thalassobaculum litoreum DSM 18839]
MTSKGDQQISAIRKDPLTPVKTLSDLTQTYLEFLMQSQSLFGGGDIAVLGRWKRNLRSAAFATSMLFIFDQDQKPIIRKILVILPPGSDSRSKDGRFFELIETSFHEITNRSLDNPLTEGERTVLRKRIEVIVSPHAGSESLIDLVHGLSDGTAVIIEEANAYRFRDNRARTSTETVRIGEDIWIPEVHLLAQSLATKFADRALYFLLDVHEVEPVRSQSLDLLCSIDNCGVFTVPDEADPDAILVQHLAQWDEWIAENRVGRVLQEIDGLTGLSDDNKALLRVQVMDRAGMRLEALAIVREIQKTTKDISAFIRVKLAAIAARGGANRTARELLVAAIETLKELEPLELALHVSDEIDAPDIGAQLANILQERYPDSVGLRAYRERDLLIKKNFSALALMLKDNSDRKESKNLYEILSKYIDDNIIYTGTETPSSAIPDYDSMIADAGDDVSLRVNVTLSAIDDAMDRGLPEVSQRLLSLIYAIDTPNAKIEWRIYLALTRLLKLIFLSRDPGRDLLSDFIGVDGQLSWMIHYLARRPTEPFLRVRMERALNPSISGGAGLVLIARVALELASRPVEVKQRVVLKPNGLKWLSQNKNTITSLMEHAEREHMVMVGRFCLPEDALPAPPDYIFSGLIEYIQNAPIADSEDINALLTQLALAMAIAKHTSYQDYDLVALRLATERMVGAGFQQEARDLVEEALLGSAESPHRRRLAWFTMADVYQRCRNPGEALIALACCFAASGQAHHDHIYWERLCLVRILRDIGLFDLARSGIEQLRKFEDEEPISDHLRIVIDTMDLQVDILAHKHEQKPEKSLETLFDRAIILAERVIEANEQPEPIASLLQSLKYHAEETGDPVPDSALLLLSRLMPLSDPGLARILRAQNEKATANDLLAMLPRGRATRYSEDVGFEGRDVAILAGQLLARDEFLSSPDDVSFALEVLADRGVAIPSWDEAATPPPRPTIVSEVGESARRISEKGISVVQLGWDARGRMVRLYSSEGSIGPAEREPSELISEERYNEWKERFPYAYGVEDDDPNIFYTSTMGLQISPLPSGPIVIVGDVDFQSFPVNLLFSNNNFAGRMHPIAAAPSLSWLAHAVQIEAIGDGRRCAWISSSPTSSIVSDSESSVRANTLDMLAERLTPTLEKFGIEFDQRAVLPEDFSGAELVVIAAHGGVHLEHQYFQVVADEENLRVSAQDLANSLRNIGVAILFVCSGGRSDRYPGANTILGLAKQVLDRGCLAVIASPWPLDARVPSHWLPVFLEAWDQGISLIDATFRANSAVDAAFGLNPAHGLAMSVFGNPILRKSDR